MMQQDKLLHFFYGSIILHLSMVLFNPYISIAIVAVIGGAKELIYDKYMNKGNCEWLDFIYTIAPCFLYLMTLVF